MNGKIEVTGKDRVSFLHNILTHDIQKLKAGQSCPAALLSSTAKVLMLMRVSAFDDKILLEVEPGYEKKLAGLLDQYLITEDVEIKILEEKPAPPALESGEIQRIENGVLRYGVDVTEEVSLPETGLEDAFASETKGCYPGQEVVARTKTYKGLQRKITGLVILSGWSARQSSDGSAFGEKDLARFFGQWPQNDAFAKNKIYSKGKEIGWVTSACVSPAFGGIALGYVTKGFFEKTAEVEIKTAAGTISAKTVLLPFYPRSG